MIFVLVSVRTHAQGAEFDGLKFNSKNVEHFKRTSVAVFKDNPVTINYQISISFDISFWTLKYFGTIWRIDNNKKEFSRLVFNQFKDPEYYYLQLFVDQQPEPLEIKLLRKDLNRNLWNKVTIDFDLIADSILFALDNISSVSKKIKIPDNLIVAIYFGLKNLDDINDYDLPGFYLRNLIIKIDDKSYYEWKLNPADEELIYDKINRSAINLTNEAWMISDHYEWKLINSLSVYGTPLFAYDSIKARVFIDLKEKLMIYDLNSNKDTIVKYNNIRPGQFSEIIYNHFSDQLYSTFVGRGEVSVLDFNTLRWSAIDTTNELNGHYYGSVRFISPFDSALYMFGGYGWHTAKNNFFKYNFNESKWKDILFDGNISPRYNTAVSQGFNQSEVLLFGGNGNEDGNQEKGFRNYFDLYSLNLEKRTISQVWSDNDDMERLKSISIYPYIFIIPRDSSFYSLRLHSLNESFSWKMYYNQIARRNNISVGEDIPIDMKTENQYYFCFNSKTNEFVYLTYDKDSTKINIYSLRCPPVESSLFKLTETENERYSYIWILYSFLGLAFLFTIVYSFRKRKRNNAFSNNELIDKRIYQEKKNYIQLFGEVRISDASGNDLFKSFSPKLKEIFLLILIRSMSSHNNGITSEDLSVTIWPDASPESAKSNRGVAINKLRKILSSVDGIDLEFSDKLWIVKMKNGSSCDYAEYLKFCTNIKNGNGIVKDPIVTLIDIVSGGEFLKGISYDWLDSIKFSINNEVIAFLKQYCDKEKTENNDETLLKLCDVILTFDSVDIDAIKIKIKTLTSQGKLHIAKSTYGLFVAEYKRLYDENYPLTFEELIKS